MILFAIFMTKKIYDTTVHTTGQADTNLKYITSHSPFKNPMIMQSQFEQIKLRGTCIVVYNIRTKELHFNMGM